MLEWILIVEHVFDLKECAKKKKVKLVVVKLKGYGSLWWENLKRERKRTGKAKIRSWSKMKSK